MASRCIAGNFGPKSRKRRGAGEIAMFFLNSHAVNKLKARRNDSGTSLLEVALILPVLVLLILGIVDIGRYAALNIVVSNAAKAGVQYGAQSLATAYDDNGIQIAALQDAGMTTSSMQVNPSLVCYCSGSACGGPCAAPGIETLYLIVNTSGTFTPLFNYPGLSLASTVSGMAEMRVAQ